MLKNSLKIKYYRWQKDSVYESFWVNKLVNKFITGGLKAIAEIHILNSLKLAKKKIRICFDFLLFQFLEHIKPLFGIQKIYKGMANKRQTKTNETFINVPVPITFTQQYVQSISWLCDLVLERLKTEFAFGFKLSDAFLVIWTTMFENIEHASLKKKLVDYMYQVLNSRANLHYRWR